VTIEEALAAMGSFPIRRARVVRSTLAAVHGKTLAADVRASEDVPPFSRSRVDGYAVVASDVAGASKERPARLALAGEVVMGAGAPGPVRPGKAMRIPTGGALPEGADAAVMVEDTAEQDGAVIVYDATDALGNVTSAGADVRSGDLLFTAGTVMTPAKIGLLAGAGIAAVDTFEAPRVALLLTGDELIAPGDPIGPGQIRDINRFSLAAALCAMGFVPVEFERVPDDRSAYAAAFQRALSQCDAVVISGGSSAGERDYTPDVVAAAGSPGVIVHHIRAKPGRPTLLGIVGDKPVIGLPGNPVSALVMLETVGKPILLRMLERDGKELPRRAILSEAIDVSPHLEHRIPVRLRPEGSTLYADPLFGTSAQMHILGFADALVTVPLGVGSIARDAEVDAFPLSHAGTER
jgi:molybdopterin molybdotransferase